jgi:hypothetical protein
MTFMWCWCIHAGVQIAPGLTSSSVRFRCNSASKATARCKSVLMLRTFFHTYFLEYHSFQQHTLNRLLIYGETLIIKYESRLNNFRSSLCRCAAAAATTHCNNGQQIKRDLKKSSDNSSAKKLTFSDQAFKSSTLNTMNNRTMQ